MSSPTDSEQAWPRLSPSRWLERFEEQARRRPSETALTSSSGSISYEELNERSNGIADLLLSQGIGRGHFIGLGLPRSLDLPVALLGILKAGAGYIPLDPHCPAQRLQELITSAQLDHVISTQALATHFPGLRIISADDSLLSFRSRPPEENDDSIQTETSGETAPFTFQHHGAARLLRWYSITLAAEAGHQELIISKPSFDLSRRNFFSTLGTGGTLVLEDSRDYDVKRIAELVRRHDVNSIQCPTDAFYKLLEAAADNEYTALANLRVAVLDGEKASLVRLRPWLDHPNCQVEISSAVGFPEHPAEGQSQRSRFPNRRAPGLRQSEMTLNPRKLTALQAPDILSIWSRVLKRTIKDAEANFFEIGGTPIHLALIHVQLMKMTGEKFPLQELFELPSAKMTASFLSTKRLSDASGPLAQAQQAIPA